MASKRRIFACALVCALLALTGCANGTGSGGGSGSSAGSGGGSKGSLTLVGQNFTEGQILAAMYAALLTKDGYSVTTKLVDTRDIYIPQFKSGAVDVAPEYVSGLADYLNTLKHGANAPTVTSPSLSKSLAALKPLAADYNITMLKPSQAVDANAFAVTKQYAQKYHLSTLSDLGSLNKPITLAAASDCKGRTDCAAGLTNVYGINIVKVLPLGYATPQTINSVKSGESQLAEVATTQSNLAQEGLVILTDDKHIQPAQNVIPAVQSGFLKSNPDVATTLDKLSSVLTTQDLTQLNSKVDVNREDPTAVAKAYLKSKGLL